MRNEKIAAAEDEMFAGLLAELANRDEPATRDNHHLRFANGTEVYLSITPVWSDTFYRSAWTGVLLVTFQIGKTPKRFRTRKAGWRFREMAAAALAAKRVIEDAEARREARRQAEVRLETDERVLEAKRLATQHGLGSVWIEGERLCLDGRGPKLVVDDFLDHVRLQVCRRLREDDARTLRLIAELRDIEAAVSHGLPPTTLDEVEEQLQSLAEKLRTYARSAWDRDADLGPVAAAEQE